MEQTEIPDSLKPAPRAGFAFGTAIEMIVQVFHRILDLKHGPGFLSGTLFFYEPLLRAGSYFGISGYQRLEV
jgi:hypothetical protein